VYSVGRPFSGGGYTASPGTDQASSGDTAMRSVILPVVMFQIIISVAMESGPS
jgi:hypothetical protein